MLGEKYDYKQTLKTNFQLLGGAIHNTIHFQLLGGENMYLSE